MTTETCATPETQEAKKPKATLTQLERRVFEACLSSGLTLEEALDDNGIVQNIIRTAALELINPAKINLRLKREVCWLEERLTRVQKTLNAVHSN